MIVMEGYLRKVEDRLGEMLDDRNVDDDFNEHWRLFTPLQDTKLQVKK